MPPRIAQSWYKVRLSFYLNLCFIHYSIGLLQVMTSMNVERIETIAVNLPLDFQFNC